MFRNQEVKDACEYFTENKLNIPSKNKIKRV